MRKIILGVALIAIAYIKPSFAQSNETQSLLTSYYDIKNALVNSDASAAALKATAFSKAWSNIDVKSLPLVERTAFLSYQDKLALDVKQISERKDIAVQREHFAKFSTHFFELAKVVKLTKDPVYYDYCPMKKSYWLSEQAAIKNPYYGKQMLTCGTIKETLK